MVALFALTGFAVIEFTVQHERVRWEARYVGAAYNTVVPEDTDLSHCFYPGGTAYAANPFSHAFYRTIGFQCTWGVAGTTDGGTNEVYVKVVHEDAGVDCRCSLGTCSGSASVEKVCSCAEGIVELGKAVGPDAGEALAYRYCMQLDPLTTCLANPAQMSCSVDLVR